MKIELNPFLYPKKYRSKNIRPATLFGRGVDTTTFARDDYYTERKTFRMGPIHMKFKPKRVPKNGLNDDLNATIHN